MILAGVLLAAGLPVVGSGLGTTGCTDAIGQDDAGAGRDAGVTLETAVPVVIDDSTYQASLAYPKATTSLDALDRYSADWGDDPQKVTFSATTYLAGYEAPVDPVPYRLSVWAPGDTPDQDPPTYQAGPDEAPSLTFTTEPGTWYFEVALAGVQPGSGCAGTTAATAPMQVYTMYLGCDPHCSSTTTA